MPVSPRMQEMIATFDAGVNPSGEVSVLQSKVTSPVVSNEIIQPVLQVEARDEIPKSDSDNWLQKTDSDDLSLYYDGSEDHTDDPIIGSAMDGRDEAALSAVALESEEGKQELKETLAILGIDLSGEDTSKAQVKIQERVDDRSTAVSIEKESEKGTSTSELTSNVRQTESADETTISQGSAPVPKTATPNELPSSTSEEDISKPSDLQIINMIEELENSHTLEEADNSMKSLDMAMDNRVVPDKADRIHIAKTIAKLDGTRIIMEAMEKWQSQSGEIADVATCLLVALTQVVPEASMEIAKVGLDGIVKTGKAQPDNYFLRGNVLALLLNLSTLEDERTKEAISTDSCIDIVVQTMQKWPDKAYIQKCGAGYFVRINKIQAERKETVKVEEQQVKEPEKEAPQAAAVVVKSVPKVEETAPAANDANPTAPARYPNVPPSEEVVAKMLRTLRDSKDEEAAAEAVKDLVRATDSRFIKSSADRKKVAERIVSLNGVAAIILALEKWFSKSQKFSYYALTLLVSISKFVAGSRQTIATIGCATVLDTAGRHADDYYIRGNALFLLQNLANHKHPATKYEVAASDCIDCVVDTMQRWPEDAHIQLCGCDYFARIIDISGMPTKLHSREIDVLLLCVMDTFEQKGDKEICERAKSVMDKIHEDAA